MKPLTHYTGPELRFRRQRRGWSQREMARRAGLRHGSVQYMERQAKLNPNRRGTKAIARVLRWKLPDPKHIDPLEGMPLDLAGICRLMHDTKTPGPAHTGPCGAKTRAGTPCKLKPLKGKRRCKFHGGLSTGPKTAEGRARISAAMRERRRRERDDEAGNLAPALG